MQLLKNSAQSGATALPKETAHQSVYENLRGKILFGDLAPGQAVTIKGLSEEIQSGLTPVREAIRRLISDGALKMMGNRRVIVPVLTENCIEELDFMRKSLEPQLARRAAQHMTDGAFRTLLAHDHDLNTAISEGDIQGYLTQNYNFHATVYALAEAPIMSATVDRLWLRFGPSLRVVCGRYGTMNLPDKHADLLKAFKNGDASAAAHAMAEDVAQGMVQIKEALQETPTKRRLD